MVRPAQTSRTGSDEKFARDSAAAQAQLKQDLADLEQRGFNAAQSWENDATDFLPAAFVDAAIAELGTRSDFSMIKIGGYMNAKRCRLVLVNEEMQRFVELDQYAKVIKILARPGLGGFSEHLPNVLDNIGIPLTQVGDISLVAGEEGEEPGEMFVVVDAEIATRATQLLKKGLGNVESVEIVEWENMRLPGKLLDEEDMGPKREKKGGKCRRRLEGSGDLSDALREAMAAGDELEVVRLLKAGAKLKDKAVDSGLPETEESWFEEWHEKVSCWLETLPEKEEVQRCTIALSLHLSSKLEDAVSSALSSQKLSFSSAFSLTAQPQGVVAAEARERGCEWISLLKVPEFPAFGGSFEFMQPALPRLVPWGMKKWQELGVESPQSHAPAGGAASVGGAMVGGTMLASVGGVGFTLGALLMLRLGGVKREPRARIGTNSARFNS